MRQKKDISMSDTMKAMADPPQPPMARARRHPKQKNASLPTHVSSYAKVYIGETPSTPHKCTIACPPILDNTMPGDGTTLN
jgi:hypothetical protein